MCKKFVILFSLFIRLVSGYIVSSIVSEAEHAEKENTTLNATNINPNLNTLENITLFNGNEIFEHAEEKATNISERSLIFINKRLKSLLKGPARNNYQAFIPKPGDDIREMNQNEDKFPDSTKPIKQQHQLFNPNAELRNSLTQNVYRYVYPETPKRNKSCKHRGKIENEFHLVPINTPYTEPIKPLDEKYVIKTPVKIMDIKSHELFKNNHEITNIKAIAESQSKPEQHSKNMRITSHKHRTPKSNSKGCGFFKHNTFHKMTYINQEQKINPLEEVHTDDSGTVYEDGNLDRYIKQALIELKMTDNGVKESWDDDAEIKKTKHDIEEISER